MATITHTAHYGSYQETLDPDSSVGAAIGVVMILLLFAFFFMHAIPGVHTTKADTSISSVGISTEAPVAALDSGDTSRN